MNQDTVSDWARSLQQSPLKGFLLPILEGGGPLKVILAQLMLGGAPFVGSTLQQKWQTAAEILEDDEKSRQLSRMIREEKSH
ncbi:MAG: hypothetical protein VB013_01290 [Anaerolineaceae bacterium]|nr:hypothetical protein [Anaerolineaceae bacterium]